MIVNRGGGQVPVSQVLQAADGLLQIIAINYFLHIIVG